MHFKDLMLPITHTTYKKCFGDVVFERRETCWMADEGIGGLAYSGKIMAPVPFTQNVAAVRDAIEKQSGIYYDCCLINWYDDGECAVSTYIFVCLPLFDSTEVAFIFLLLYVLITLELLVIYGSFCNQHFLLIDNKYAYFYSYLVQISL